MDIIRKKAMLTKKDLDEYTKSDPKGEGFDDDQEMSGTSIRVSKPTEEETAKRFEHYLIGSSFNDVKTMAYKMLECMALNSYSMVQLYTEFGTVVFTLKNPINDDVLRCDLRL